MAGFSWYMAFTGRLAEQARVIIRYGKKLPLVNIFAVTDGVITGFFDKNGNPDKAYLDVAGTAFKSFIKFLFILNCNYIFIKNKFSIKLLIFLQELFKISLEFYN